MLQHASADVRSVRSSNQKLHGAALETWWPPTASI
jgi:hypothetical protein